MTEDKKQLIKKIEQVAKEAEKMGGDGLPLAALLLAVAGFAIADAERILAGYLHPLMMALADELGKAPDKDPEHAFFDHNDIIQ